MQEEACPGEGCPGRGKCTCKAPRQERGWIQMRGGGTEVSSFPLQFNQTERTRELVGKLKTCQCT